MNKIVNYKKEKKEKMNKIVNYKKEKKKKK